MVVPSSNLGSCFADFSKRFTENEGRAMQMTDSVVFWVLETPRARAPEQLVPGIGKENHGGQSGQSRCGERVMRLNSHKAGLKSETTRTLQCWDCHPQNC